LRGVQFDGVDVTGVTLTLNDDLNVDLQFGSAVDWSNPFWASNKSWLVFDNLNSPSVFDNGLSGSGSLFYAFQAMLSENLNPLDGQGDGLQSVRPGDGFVWALEGSDLYLRFTPVPEPA
jgi:hypothetical protein